MARVGKRSELGNTILGDVNSSLERVEEKNDGKRIRCRKWTFTAWNVGEKQFGRLVHTFKHKKWKFVIGEEVCPSTGKPHYQGWIEHDHPIDRSCIFKLLCWNAGEPGTMPKLEKAAGEAWDNLLYCRKDGKWIMDGVAEPEYIEKPDFLKITDLYGWQLELVKLLETTPNDRDVIWIWDPVGCSGKSKIRNFLMDNKLANYLALGKSNDLMFMLLKNKNSRDIVIDCPRGESKYISYKLIEELKDGCIFSSKYEGGCKRITTPHIVIFANEKPQWDRLTRDRWNVFAIPNAKGKLVPIETGY